jgi:hypothetical protein
MVFLFWAAQGGVRVGQAMRTDRSCYKASLILVMLLVSACAHLVNVLDHVNVGMDKEQATGNTQGNPTPYCIKNGSAEYVLFRVVTNFVSMYGEQPYDVLFIRFENGRVVDKGVVNTSEEEKIRQIRPTFFLREWRGAGQVASDSGC